MRGQGGCADDVGRGVVGLPWQRWEEVGGTHVVEAEMDGGDSRVVVMIDLHQSVMSEVTKGEVGHPTSDEDERDSREASADLVEGSLLGCLWLRSTVSMVWEALNRMRWEESIRRQIQSMRHLSVRRNTLAKSMMTRGGHMVAGTCPCETSGAAQFSYDRWSIRCSGRSCALIRFGGKDCALCDRVRQIPSTISPYREIIVPSSSVG